MQTPERAIPTPTADLYDVHGDDLESCEVQFEQFGGRPSFEGEIVTVRCNEDNVLLRATLATSGKGKVLVVDGGGSLRRALVGDIVAGLGVDNGWEGIVIYGAVRDRAALQALDIGLKACGTSPRASAKTGEGERGVEVAFGDALFTPGAHLVSDGDGVVVLPQK